MRKHVLFNVAMIALFLALLGGARLLANTAAAAEPAASTQTTTTDNAGSASEPGFDFFSDKPVQSEQVIELPPEKSKWISIGGPAALVGFFFFVLFLNWWTVPFSDHSVELNLRDLPPAAKRGIAMAVAIFGLAFCFGASEIWYQLTVHGSAEAYFAQMSLGKLIAFTHAHLFGFTTSFFIVGIPFSMQFNHIKSYQWVFPIGLSAALTDVISWWGIKYLHSNFEYVSMLCGVLFSITYLWMLIGLLRVLLFPEVIWASDKDAAQRLAARRAIAQAAKHHEGDY